MSMGPHMVKVIATLPEVSPTAIVGALKHSSNSSCILVLVLQDSVVERIRHMLRFTDAMECFSLLDAIFFSNYHTLLFYGLFVLV
mmetsp:Transcript_4082/g.3018  ORF Transcript_4082/g.3018 Transcript_4082/m.3018 type:complete len:85 (-) Transcript_4082:489-743(-)